MCPTCQQIKFNWIKKNLFLFTDLSRLDKSPLLANGYNAPPTHLNPMAPFMAQMGHHGAPLMSPGMPPHGLPRPGDAMMKNQNIPGMEAITRQMTYLFYY